MPAIITHHLFGEEASHKLPEGICFDEEELLAFLLANQGPDPFYFCFTAPLLASRTCHDFAEAMHASHELGALTAARDAVRHLPEEDQGVGRAFVLGLLAHYLLDSEAHPFITSQVDAICGADVGLEDAQEQVDALIQSDLDTWMLWCSRKQTINDTPAWANLTRTPRTGRIAGTIFSQVAWQIFGIKLRPERYEQSLHDYELLYHTIDPRGNLRGRVLAEAERLGTRYSLLDALAHTDQPSDECASANLACHPWRNPFDNSEHTTSFADIFYDTLELWPALAEAFSSSDDDALTTLMRHDYQGRPLSS